MNKKLNLTKLIDQYELDVLNEAAEKYKTIPVNNNFVRNSNNFFYILDQTANLKCINIIRDVRSTFYLDSERLNNVYPINNKEKEAEEVYRNMERCFEPYEMIKSEVNETIRQALNFYYSQSELCRFNCLRQLSAKNFFNVKVCLRRCIFYTADFMNKGIEDALEEYLDEKIDDFMSHEKLMNDHYYKKDKFKGDDGYDDEI